MVQHAAIGPTALQNKLQAYKSMIQFSLCLARLVFCDLGGMLASAHEYPKNTSQGVFLQGHLQTLWNISEVFRRRSQNERSQNTKVCLQVFASTHKHPFMKQTPMYVSHWWIVWTILRLPLFISDPSHTFCPFPWPVTCNRPWKVPFSPVTLLHLHLHQSQPGLKVK